MRPQHRAERRPSSRDNNRNAGLLAVGSNAVDDGHGHLIRHGTNAPFFTMPFIMKNSSRRDDLECYRGRVASALNIDRIRKILDFNLHLSVPRFTALQVADVTANIVGPLRCGDDSICRTPVEYGIPRTPFADPPQILRGLSK